MSPQVSWPEGKSFAFTVFDDCDYQNAQNVRPVYDLLADLGFRTTKSVWTIQGGGPAGRKVVDGATCEDRDYLDWALNLQTQGFEIGLHNVSFQTSPREQTLRGLERFNELFGHFPKTMANHTGCRESIYWGDARLSGLHRAFYNLLHRNRHKNAFQGHDESSEWFWGDACQEKITYVRNFVFGDINTLKCCPEMPYHDPARPYVKCWFASSEGPVAAAFVKMISEENQDRLADEHGACIMYAHFACGFCEQGRLDPRFRALMERLARMNGWFVPVHVLLDRLGGRADGPCTISTGERRRLERQWLLHKLRTRGTT